MTDWIDKILLVINPRAAVIRRHWREQHARLYEAAKLHHQHRRPGMQGSADNAMEQARENIRDWARHLDENHDLAIGILSTLVDKTVGAEIKMMPAVTGKDGKLIRQLNQDIAGMWREWTRRPEVTHEYNFAGVQRLMARTLYRDGEVLGQHVLGNTGRVVHGGKIPYSLEMIEADFLPFDLTDKDRNIVHGVEKTAWGRPRAYHIYKQAPENIRNLFLKPQNQELKRISAELMIHAKFCRRIGQTRGVSIFHGVAHRLDDIKDYEESERIAARIGASMAAFIKKGAEFDSASYYSALTDDKIKSRTIEMQGGQIYDNLLPGEDIGTIDVDRPNSALLDYRNSQLRAIAAGTSTSYSSIARDFSGNYSSQRQELVESVTPYAALREYQVFAIYQPIYEKFIEAAVLSNQLKMPAGLDMLGLYASGWIAPAQPWIDPQKEANADQIAVENHFVPWSQIVLQRTGRDPMLVLEQMLEEKELLAELTPPAPAAVPPAGDTNADDTNADDTNIDDTNADDTNTDKTEAA